MSLIASEVNLEIGRLLAFDVREMVRLGIPFDEAVAIRDEFRGWMLTQEPPAPAPVPAVEPERFWQVEPPRNKRTYRKRRRREPRGEVFEAYDPGIGVNLTIADLDELPADDEVDLDSIEALWAYRAPRFNAFPSWLPVHRR